MISKVILYALCVFACSYIISFIDHKNIIFMIDFVNECSLSPECVRECRRNDDCQTILRIFKKYEISNYFNELN